MENNVHDKHERDKVEQRIVERLGSRRRKIEQVEAWERKARMRVRALYSAVSVAACLAIVFVSANLFSGQGSVIDELGIARPQIEAFRWAAPELARVEKLIAAGEYHDALDIVEAELKKSDACIEQAEAEPAFDDEEWLYEYKAEKLVNAELRWNYIYLLVMVGCERSAVKELKRYMQEEEFCRHRKDAEALLNALT